VIKCSRSPGIGRMTIISLRYSLQVLRILSCCRYAVMATGA